MSPKRAINLARVSTPQQAKLYSLDYQLEQERMYADDMGLVVVAEFKDDVSGRKLERDGLEEACRMLERDEADVLITYNFDRLHRNYVNSVLLRERIRQAGKEIHYAQTRTISGKTARERLPEDIQFIMAEIEADSIRERAMSGKEGKAKAGKWIANNRPPYGYYKVGMGKNAEMVIDEWEALRGEGETAAALLQRINNGELPAEVLPLLQAGKATAVAVRLMFAWYILGEPNGKPLSTFEIAQKLTALNIPTPEDLLPNRAKLKKRGYGQWSRGSITHLLHVSSYRGIYHNFTNIRIGNRALKNPNKDDYISVPVPKIVPEEIWNKAQEKLGKGRSESTRGVKFEYLVGMRIKCECGYSMRSHTSHHNYTNKQGTTKVHLHGKYSCPGHGRVHDRVKPCTMPSVSKNRVDERVW
jgi:DNA invertase Pin-like site-specific DNA recombinase